LIQNQKIPCLGVIFQKEERIVSLFNRRSWNESVIDDMIQDKFKDALFEI
jgi:hypothetical protein